MIKILKLLLFVFLFSDKSFSQVKEYKLIDKTLSADIDYESLNKLDTSKPGLYLFDSVFKTTKGKFIVYRFLATFKGLSFTDEQKEFHDILILKTNDNNKIIDAFQYTLEWAEPPSETDLYKSTCKDVYLKDKMTIDKFVFTRPWYYDKADIALKETAIIKLK